VELRRQSRPKTGRSAPPWASVALDADWAQLEPDFKAGKKALGAEDWNRAIVAFELAALRDPLNADIQNYIGYAYRRLRQMGPAIGHYQQALMLNPRHRGAHEHLGEAYLVLGESAKAEQLLAALEKPLPHSLRGIQRPQAGHYGVQKAGHALRSDGRHKSASTSAGNNSFLCIANSTNARGHAHAGVLSLLPH